MAPCMLLSLLLHRPRGRLMLAQLLARRLPKLPDAIRRGRDLGHHVRNLSLSDQARHDRRANDEGQHEAVHAVPGRGPAAARRGGVGVVEEDEGKELGDEGVGGRHEDGGPGDGGGDDADGVARVADAAAVVGPFHAPVDGAEEGQNL